MEIDSGDEVAVLVSCKNPATCPGYLMLDIAKERPATVYENEIEKGCQFCHHYVKIGCRRCGNCRVDFMENLLFTEALMTIQEMQAE